MSFSGRLLKLVPVLLVAAGAQALTVTGAPAPPASGILLSRNVAGDVGSYLCNRGIGTAAQIGQTFRLPVAATLDRLTLRARPETDVAGTLVILYFGTFSDEHDVTMNTLMASEIAPLPSPLAIGEVVYLTFDLSNQLLEAGQQYGFVLGFSGGDHPGDARLDLLHLGADSYADGQAIEWAGLQETALANDLVFYLQGAGGSVAEPLLLLGGRFAIEATWRTLDRSGVGHPVALSDESGTFWFFTSPNVELIVKVVDACVDPWQRYWVFMAGLTNVEVDLRVRDLVAGFEETYSSDWAEPFPTILDTWTFATCGAD